MIMKEFSYSELTMMLCEFNINIFRYDAYVRSVVFKHLDQVQKDLIARMMIDDLGSISKRDIQRLVRDIKTIITDEYERILVYLSETNQQFYIASHHIEAQIYNTWLGAKVFSYLPNYKLDAIRYAPLFEGRDIKDWWIKQSEDLKFKVESIIRNGNVLAETPQAISRQIRDQINIVKRHADSIVRTANAAIANDALERLIDHNTDLITAKQHISTLDGNTSDVCKARDLKKWTVDNRPVGHKMPFRKPPLHFRCRSIIRLLLQDQVASTRASQFGQVNEHIDYSSWLKTQTQEYQISVLGEQKAKWFREGKLTIGMMLDQNDRPLTIKQLKKIYNL